MLYDQYGAWPQALADYEAAQRLTAQAGDRFRSYIVQVWAGRAHTMAGNPIGTTFAMSCLHAFYSCPSRRCVVCRNPVLTALAIWDGRSAPSA
jgi:hypothetical protein